MYTDPSGNNVWDVVKGIWETIKVAYGSMMAEQILYSAGEYEAYETLSNEYQAEKSAIISYLQFTKDFVYYNYLYSAAPKPTEPVLETGYVSWSSGGLGNKEWLQKWYEDTYGVKFKIVDDADLIAGGEVHAGEAVVGSRSVQLAKSHVDTGVLRQRMYSM